MTRNRILDNVGASPLSGGIVLFKSFVGATSERNRITRQRAGGQRPGGPGQPGTRGTGNTFTGNTCRASEPAGLC